MTSVVFACHPATRKSGEVNFVTLLRTYAKATGEDTKCDCIMVSEEVPLHTVYLCRRGGRLHIPMSTKGPKDWEKGTT